LSKKKVKPVERSEEVRPGTLLETDEDIRQALLAKAGAAAATPRQGTLPETEEDVRQALLAKQAGAAAKPSSPVSTASPYRPTLRAPVALLTVLDDGKNDGEVLRLRTDRFVIGRSEGDFLIPHDSLISARHLEITLHRAGEPYRWVLTDLKTTNGLFIRCSRIALVDQAEFLVGKGRYRFEAPGGGLPNTLDYPGADVQRGATNALGTDAAALLHPALIELLGEKMLSRLPLAKPEYWIGSHPACSICRVGDPFVEPQHVRLRRDANGAWLAQNNKAANGLWLRVPQVTVTDSCSFQIGEQRFRLKVGG
jgi:pSer/pThr/pTyr-binding forkhead associated (FHA) protein